MIIGSFDIGSRTTKFVLLEDTVLKDYCIVDTGTDPISKVKEILHHYFCDKVIATGYGRYLFQKTLGFPIISEIKAHAQGACYFFPNCRTVIDIGGQDSKVIRVRNGKVEHFEMNDRCAAGTGRFLEVMATTLGFRINDFGEYALQGKNSITLNSMCTVFAESEVISLISCGENVYNIALGIHNAIVNRIWTMIVKSGYEDDIVFTGGVAKNRCIGVLLKERLNRNIYIPQEPQIVGALGAGLSLLSNG
ncbi:MAG: acyl-CoA dehydratase activase [candidate division WOR-3 bacterium]|nr:acyl-CoA dehydratase activase [candidate division WOR-3 bacterium]